MFLFFGIVLYAIAWRMPPPVDSDFPLAVKVALAALFVGLVLILLYRKMLRDRDRHVGQFTNSMILSGMVPFFLTCYAPTLFVPACGVPHVSDFFWYTLDNVAKGALIDVLQSFHIDFFACEPRRVFWVSCINLAIRSYVSAIVVWFGVRALMRWREFKVSADVAA
jgi:hypothetical protein